MTTTGATTGARDDGPPGRWPLHPPPGDRESLSSWLDRIAVLYRMTSDQLIGPQNLPLSVVPYHAYQLDVHPPPAVLTALSQRTGQSVDRLKAMTLSGWEGCLLDHLLPGDRPYYGREFFNYVRSNPVLLPLGEAGVERPDAHFTRWIGPWLPAKWLDRHCPVCVTDQDRGRELMWRLPLVLGCHEHGCYLEDLFAATFHYLLHDGQPMPPRPIPEPLATLERYTYSALNTGLVELPGRTVQAAVWFRMLRSLLDEVSLAITPRRKRPRETLRAIWKAAGLPPRGGLGKWAPYEVMEPEQQHAMMTAVAAALDLAAKGEILAQGRLGPAIQPFTSEPVYDGDRPPPARNAWQELVAEIELMLDHARSDPTVAGDALQLLTRTCKTLRQYEVRRGYLLGAGVPAAFLPGPAQSGRTDLV